MGILKRLSFEYNMFLLLCGETIMSTNALLLIFFTCLWGEICTFLCLPDVGMKLVSIYVYPARGISGLTLRSQGIFSVLIIYLYCEEYDVSLPPFNIVISLRSYFICLNLRHLLGIFYLLIFNPIFPSLLWFLCYHIT